MTDHPQESFGERVRRLRQDAGWSQEQLCKRAGISKSFLSELENDASEPGAPVLVKLANALGASTDYLLTGREPEAAQPRAIEIPPSLAAFAEKRSLPFNHVLALNDVLSQITARRRDGGPREPSVEEWSKIYEALLPHLPKE